MHMMEHILGEDVFREGIQNYLKKHQFTAVVANNLWDALQEVYDRKYRDQKLNIQSTIEPWINQTGYPMLKVTRDEETNDIVIIQIPNSLLSAGNTWKIPINYATKSNPDFSSTAPTMWMERDQKELKIPNIPKDDWIIVNIQQRGFYRVNYDKDNWDKLIKYLHSDDFKKIRPVNRAQLIQDMFTLFEDESKVDLLPALTLYLHQEQDYLVWIPVVQILQRLEFGGRYTHEEDTFRNFLLIATNKIAKRLGFEHREDDEYSTTKIRSILAPFLCEYEHAGCTAFAHHMFNTYLKNPSDDVFPLKDWKWIVCAGLRKSNKSVWNKFMTTDMPMPERIKNFKYNFIKCIPSNKQRDKFIAQTMQKGSKVKTDQINAMFEAFFKSHGNDAYYIMDYIEKHFKDIEEYYDQAGDDVIVLLSRTDIFCNNAEDQLSKLQKLVETIIPLYNAKKFKPENLLEFRKSLNITVYDRMMIELEETNIDPMIRKILGMDAINENKKKIIKTKNI